MASLPGVAPSGPKAARYIVQPGMKVKQPGDHQPEEVGVFHRPAMILDLVPAGVLHALDQHHQHEDRDQVDRAEWSPQPEIVQMKNDDTATTDHHAPPR